MFGKTSLHSFVNKALCICIFYLLGDPDTDCYFAFFRDILILFLTTQDEPESTLRMGFVESNWSRST